MTESLSTAFPYLPDTIRHVMDTFNNGKILPQEYVQQLLNRSIDIFSKENNYLDLGNSVAVTGSLYGMLPFSFLLIATRKLFFFIFQGKYIDLLNVLKKQPDPAKSQLVFLGNFVNGGKQSMEVLLLLLSYKIAYPKSVYLIRGRSETEEACRLLNFKDICLLS